MGKGSSAVSQTYCFIDKDVRAGSYYYLLKQIDSDKVFEYSNILEEIMSLPEGLYYFRTIQILSIQRHCLK